MVNDGMKDAGRGHATEPEDPGQLAALDVVHLREQLHEALDEIRAAEQAGDEPRRNHADRLSIELAEQIRQLEIRQGITPRVVDFSGGVRQTSPEDLEAA